MGISKRNSFTGEHFWIFKFRYNNTFRVSSMNSDEQRWNVTFRFVIIAYHPTLANPGRWHQLLLVCLPGGMLSGVEVTRSSVMGPTAGCGLIATMAFLPCDIITAYEGELIWMPAVTAKASVSSDDRAHSHFKRISGSDFVISGFKGVGIKFGSGGASV